MNPSKPISLEAEAIEAAAKAIYEAEEHHADLDSMARVSIHAFLDAMEMRVEEADGKVSVEGQGYLPAKLYRFVSAWFPIKGPIDE